MRKSLLSIVLMGLCLGCFNETPRQVLEQNRTVDNFVIPSESGKSYALPSSGFDIVQNGHHHPRGLELHPVHLNPVGQVDLFPEEEDDFNEELSPSRRRVRMNIDQLDDAITNVTGGIGWTEGNGNNPTNVFEELSLTLGKPDYIQLVIEDLSPSGLFLKFLDDAARSVCQKLVEEEYFNRTPAQRVLLGDVGVNATYESDAEAIDTQLIRLSLRYHGVHLPVDSGALENLRWLFQMAQWRAAQPEAGWEAVCVSLMTDPAFYSY